jgi:hypothetical protein
MNTPLKHAIKLGHFYAIFAIKLGLISKIYALKLGQVSCCSFTFLHISVCQEEQDPCQKKLMCANASQVLVFILKLKKLEVIS